MFVPNNHDHNLFMQLNQISPICYIYIIHTMSFVDKVHSCKLSNCDVGNDYSFQFPQVKSSRGTAWFMHNVYLIPMFYVLFSITW